MTTLKFEGTNPNEMLGQITTQFGKKAAQRVQRFDVFVVGLVGRCELATEVEIPPHLPSARILEIVGELTQAREQLKVFEERLLAEELRQRAENADAA